MTGMDIEEYIEEAIRGAAEGVLWQASDASENGGRSFPISDGGNEWSEKVVSDVPYITEAVTAFVQGNWALLQIAAEHRPSGYNGSQCGHDLILTANGHGTGFWDRGLDMPATNPDALIAWQTGRASYLAWLAGYCLYPLNEPRTVGDVLTTNSKGYSFEAEFDLDEDGKPTWIMVENVVLLDLAGYSSGPDES